MKRKFYHRLKALLHFLLVLLGVLCLFLTGNAQEGVKKSPFLFNEFGVSLNRTILTGTGIENRFGFGFGVYHNFSSDKKIQLVCGLEYTLLRLFEKDGVFTHYSNEKDISYTLHHLSLPVNLRIMLGKQQRIFLEAGVFFDFNLKAVARGTKDTYFPGTSLVTTNFKNSGTTSPYFGPSLGIGRRQRLAKFAMLVKLDYRLGLIQLGGDQTFLFNPYLRLGVGFSK